MLGYAALVRGLLDMGFSYNVLHISRRIGRGQMDHTLVQPQPVWMGLLTEGFMPFSGSWSLFTGIGILDLGNLSTRRRVYAVLVADVLPAISYLLVPLCSLSLSPGEAWHFGHRLLRKKLAAARSILCSSSSLFRWMV